MSRRVIWTAVVAAALATLAALWFFGNFERVPVKRHEGMQKEARRNPYLALERLFSRLGRTVTRVGNPAALDALGEDEVLILAWRRQRLVTPERAGRLLRWVERGGYLIVEAEPRGKDPLLEAFGVVFAKPSSEEKDPPASYKKCGKPYVEVDLPGDPTPYRRADSSRGLAAGKDSPEWRAGGQGGELMLHYARGRGNVTVVEDLDFLDNRNLGDFDHAALGWALAQRYQPGGAVRLAVRLEHPTLWQWLAESAWMALISVAALVALWLWRVVPRFGGTRAAPGAARRDLTQHLLAIGRSVWREGGLGHLRELARREIAQRLAQRHPSLARGLSGERHAALARMSGLDSRRIGEALADERPPSPETFTQAMQTLQRLEHKL
ncbi:MAG: DUF4350 domain-containing protein [Candidatus Accumulibacter sp.]|nr:DUF4350 domain-containing protein [Accumulibacter sp.]